MAELSANGLTSSLQDLIDNGDIKPGESISYQLCKDLYIYHPMGAKLVDAPIALAQTQEREIAVPAGPESRLIEAFEREWEELNADRYIANIARLARVYGIASIAVIIDGVKASTPLEYSKLYKQSITFSCFDPLNTSGSFVLNQDPLAIDFLKIMDIRVQGEAFHRSRFVAIQNEDPIYIAFNTSSFGFTGRSIYQRALFPLKSFIQTMLTDDLVAYKAGVIVTKIRQPGSIIDKAMSYIAGLKRMFVKVAAVGNIISIAPDEAIETLNFQNLHNPFQMARKNIIDNIASAAGMPALIINEEPLTDGFGEGIEDAKKIAQCINGIRLWMQPLYAFFDKITMHRAWNEDFYAAIQRDFPEEYGDKDYNTAFYEWTNSFDAIWPNLIQEPDSDKVMVAHVKLKAAIELLEVLTPLVDPENKARVIQATMDNINAMKDMFSTPFELDYDAIAEYVPPEQEMMLAKQEGAFGGGNGAAGPPKPKPPNPMQDRIKGKTDSSTAVADLAAYQKKIRDSRHFRKPSPRLTYGDSSNV
jgi:hypothetical protein